MDLKMDNDDKIVKIVLFNPQGGATLGEQDLLTVRRKLIVINITKLIL